LSNRIFIHKQPCLQCSRFWTNGFKREVPKRCSRKLSSSTNRLVNINPACNLSRGKNSNLYKRNNKLELTLNTKSKKQNLILILSDTTSNVISVKVRFWKINPYPCMKSINNIKFPSNFPLHFNLC